MQDETDFQHSSQACHEAPIINLTLTPTLSPKVIYQSSLNQ